MRMHERKGGCRAGLLSCLLTLVGVMLWSAVAVRACTPAQPGYMCLLLRDVWQHINNQA